MTDIYGDYDLRLLVDYYTGYVKSSSRATALMERKYGRLAERVTHLSETGAAMDWYKVSVSSEHIADIMPCIYQDLKGQLWYVESPIDGLVLPELCLHF